MKTRPIFVILALFLSLFLAGPVNAGTAIKYETGYGMSIHHQHIMLNHALGMAVKGSNLVMLGQMGMAKGIDKVSAEHGNMMLNDGIKMWNEVMSGETMIKMHGAGETPANDPMMEYIHKLAEAQLKVVGLLKEMRFVSGEGHKMVMHHQHSMLNHALGMALEGSNLVMLGQMGMAKGIDELSVEHGKMMMKNARSLYDEIMSSKTMKKMHKKGRSPETDPAMAYTHQLADAQISVMNLLEKMTPVK